VVVDENVQQNVPDVVLKTPADQPAVPRVDFKVDLYGTSTPGLTADEIAAQRALRQYDESMRSWTLPPEKLDEIVASSGGDTSFRDDRYRLYRRDDFGRRDEFNPRTQRDLEFGRQRFADRVADTIYPGFGRIETKHANGATSRLDYIYTRRCGGRGGLGVCWQYRF
jgi:hypothetical protein